MVDCIAVHENVVAEKGHRVQASPVQTHPVQAAPVRPNFYSKASRPQSSRQSTVQTVSVRTTKDFVY